MGGRGVLLGAVAGVALLVAACSHPPPDSTPDGVVRLFLDDVEGASTDPRMMVAAYDLLGPAARANLDERAKRASRLLGRQVKPEDMLVGFGLGFRPKQWRRAVVGDHATVEVFGADPQNEHATLGCVKQGAVWRIEPTLPAP